MPACDARRGGGRLACAAQDLARTFPGNAWMCTGEGQAALRRVLLAFSAQNPRVGYCQSMNFLAAALLLALDRAEEKAFWVLVCLIDDGGMHFSTSQPHHSAGVQESERWEEGTSGLF